MPSPDTSASIFSPASPEARAIAHLFVITLGICGAIFAVVAGLAIYNLARFRGRAGDPDPRQVHGNKRLEIAWTVIPALILVVLFVLTVHAMPIADPPLAGPPDLRVIGHQWWWEIRYVNSGIVAANEIHIPVGRPYSLQLDTVDVLHEFWVPQLTRKITAVPAAGNHLWLDAEQPGTYEGLCSEFCGTQHAWMRFQVVAQSPADFARWEAAQKRTPAVPAGLAAQGRALFRTYTCGSCHAIQGTASGGLAGPDLTHLASRRYIGSRIVPNTPENLRKWLRDPQLVKPGAKMPSFNLTDAQIGQLVAYFQTLQ